MTETKLEKLNEFISISWIRRGTMYNFRVLTGDPNYLTHGTRWFRRTNARTYHIIDFIPTGIERINPLTAHILHPPGQKYLVTLSEVNLNGLPTPTILGILIKITGPLTTPIIVNELDLLNAAFLLGYSNTLLITSTAYADTVIRNVCKPFSRHQTFNPIPDVTIHSGLTLGINVNPRTKKRNRENPQSIYT